ncbi:MAG: prepilin-type N-terminal cleavage/methylation domain-containing protein [Lentisphaeraceae bacterium]|nr:prepilin-type N-terminal cleavage/methylation domain-containing protein [Lentisphaeraceae bacterium]
MKVYSFLTHKNASTTKHLFTLIELLVVVAIIGILFSLLLPSIRNARFKAERGVCLSNSKNLMTGTALYANDHRQEFPPYSVRGKAWVTNWFGSMPTKPGGLKLGAHKRPVNPYLVSELTATTKIDVAVCPSEVSQDFFSRHGTTYSANHGFNPGSIRSVKTMAKVNEPSRYVVISEYPTYRLIRGRDYQPNFAYHKENQYSMCFADGSAEGNYRIVPGLQFTADFTFNNNE